MSGTSETQQGRLVAEWTDRPYTDINKRYKKVQHRIVFDAHGRVGVDIRHEVRSDDTDAVPDKWTACVVYEIREHGTERITQPDVAGWL